MWARTCGLVFMRPWWAAAPGLRMCSYSSPAGLWTRSHARLPTGLPRQAQEALEHIFLSKFRFFSKGGNNTSEKSLAAQLGPSVSEELQVWLHLVCARFPSWGGQTSETADPSRRHMGDTPQMCRARTPNATQAPGAAQ